MGKQGLDSGQMPALAQELRIEQETLMVSPSTSLPLVLVLPVARILTHSAPLVCF